MKGVATSRGAITIVNALPTGIGCAIGVDLPVEAEVTLEPGPSGGGLDVTVLGGPATPLVRESVRRGLSRAEPGSGWRVGVAIRSSIPRARGLKSSSAVATALIDAAARAAGTALSHSELANEAADAGLAVGLSATGAYDDALAGVGEGFMVTDNRRRSLLRSAEAPADLCVALWIPPAEHRPSPEWSRAFTERAGEGEPVAREAIAGRWWSAMDSNSRLVESVMGYDYREIRERADRAGALASSVSGLGPAFAAVVPIARSREVIAAWPDGPGERRVVRFARARAPGSREGS